MITLERLIWQMKKHCTHTTKCLNSYNKSDHRDWSGSNLHQANYAKLPNQRNSTKPHTLSRGNLIVRQSLRVRSTQTQSTKNEDETKPSSCSFHHGDHRDPHL
jgi:hypothetical protein